MGLDMFLTRKTYVKRWDHNPPEQQFHISIMRGGNPYSAIDASKISYIEEEVGYWRKANQIHKWFVDNVQNGEDDCKIYYVSKDQLAELLEIVNKVLAASKLIDSVVANGYTVKDGQETPNFESGQIIEDATVAQELLPTASGFFFGGTDYDQWYIEDLQNTKSILEPIIARGEEDEGEYYYHSSW